MSNKIVMVLILLPVMFVTSCSRDESAQSQDSNSQSLEASKDSSDVSTDNTMNANAQDINPQPRENMITGGELRLSVSVFGENWNPRHVDGSNYSYTRIRTPMLPRFFDFDTEGVASPNPDYVRSVDVLSEAPTIVRYSLNPAAIWGDGTPVDGDDMVATWQACNGQNTDFNCASTEAYEPIENITFEADDKSVVTVTYKTAFPDWSQGFSSPAVLKAESVATPDVFNNGWGELKNEWLSGPFKIEQVDATQKVITQVPNELWWGETPMLDKIIWRLIADDVKAQAFANAELDAFDIGSNPDAFQRASQVANAEIRKASGPSFRHFTFNSRAGLLNSKEIRQAIVYALDRQAIAASDLAGIDWPVKALNNHVFLQGQAGFVDTAALTGLDYQPDKARALLDDLGWMVGDDGIREKDGEKLVVQFTQIATIKASENEALQAQSLLKEVGIQLDIVTIPTSRFGTTLAGKEFEIIAFSWVGTPYPFSGIKQIYGSKSESNYAQLSMPEVDELAEQIAVETDTSKRIDLANEADRLIWENVHTLPLYQRPELFATREDLANYGAKGLSSLRWENVGFIQQDN